MRIEQTIFTSVEGSGYRLVAASPGIDAEETRELSSWGPSHDSLLEAGPSATSMNFHRLASGRFCVSKTSPAGNEYSARGGWCIYTQSLVIAADDFLRFANNPFALIRAATAQGRMQVLRKIRAELDPLRISGKTPPIDHALVTDLLSTSGLSPILALVDALCTQSSVMLVSERQRQQLIAGLINCLPVECRSEVSFTTGLKPSPRRPYRIVCALDDSNDTKRWARDQQAVVVRPGDTTQYSPKSAWARCLNQLLAKGSTHALAGAFSASHGGLSLDKLDDLAASLANIDATSDVAEVSPPLDEVYPRLALVTNDVEQGSGGELPANEISLDDLAPTQVGNSWGSTSAGTAVARPRTAIQPSNACRSLEVLETLDDTVFDAIGGNSEALSRLKTLWPSTLESCGEDELAESREHYVRRALATWRQAQAGHNEPELLKAMQAIEVVCTLYGE